MFHYTLVHKIIPLPQVIKIQDAKAAVDKEWKKLGTLPAWDVREVKSKKEVIKEAQKNNNSPLCHTDGRMSPQKMRSWSHSSRSTKEESCS